MPAELTLLDFWQLVGADSTGFLRGPTYNPRQLRAERGLSSDVIHAFEISNCSVFVVFDRRDYWGLYLDREMEVFAGSLYASV